MKIFQHLKVLTIKSNSVYRSYFKTHLLVGIKDGKRPVPHFADVFSTCLTLPSMFHHLIAEIILY